MASELQWMRLGRRSGGGEEAVASEGVCNRSREGESEFALAHSPPNGAEFLLIQTAGSANSKLLRIN